MRTRIAILALVAGFGLVLGAGSASAGNARGAFIHDTNHPDPTVPPHQHELRFESRKATVEQACCVWNPTINAEICQSCGAERRYDNATGRLGPRFFYPTR